MIINEKPSKMRLLICVTVYNETRDDLFRTLDGIYENNEKFR